jgi:hypothetical protein
VVSHPRDTLRIGLAQQTIGDIPQILVRMDEIENLGEIAKSVFGN